MPKRAWQVCRQVARKMGNFQARMFLTIFYGLIVLPFGLATRLFADPLRIKKKPMQWLDYPDVARDLPWARRQ